MSSTLYPIFCINGYKIIVNNALYNISIDNVFINGNISALPENSIILNAYVKISHTAVADITSNITVILLSFDKFFSRYPLKKPIPPRLNVNPPIDEPLINSTINPKIKPNAVPILEPEYSPINRINITNKLGFTPAIVNQLKKFSCKKYIIMNAITNKIIVIAFFIYLFHSLFYIFRFF